MVIEDTHFHGHALVEWDVQRELVVARDDHLVLVLCEAGQPVREIANLRESTFHSEIAAVQQDIARGKGDVVAMPTVRVAHRDETKHGLFRYSILIKHMEIILRTGLQRPRGWRKPGKNRPWLTCSAAGAVSALISKVPSDSPRFPGFPPQRVASRRRRSRIASVAMGSSASAHTDRLCAPFRLNNKDNDARTAAAARPTLADDRDGMIPCHQKSGTEGDPFLAISD